MKSMQKNRQRGVSMIEVLVSIVILSIGILGVAGLQATSVRASQASLYRSQAAQYANDMAERMRANLGDARNYSLALGAASPSGSTVTDKDRADWLARLTSLPSGKGSIAIDNVTNIVTIVVQWDESRTGGSATSNFTLVTRLWNV